jgi:integrating conjugative element protein (TIGR03765 family)
MKHLLALCLCLNASVALAQPASTPLIVVEDRGGAPALPYYQPLNLLNESDAVPTPAAAPPPMANLAEAERSMLPVQSSRLSPGDEQRRAIRAPGLTPFFLIGDDDRSRRWLLQRRATLRAIHAAGMVVNVATPSGLATLRGLVPDLSLSPVTADDLATRLGIRHYPVLVTASGIEP